MSSAWLSFPGNHHRMCRPASGKVSAKNSVGGVAAEEGVGLPARARGGVGGVEEETARELLVARGTLEIDGLVHVIAWSVVAVGEPVFENFLFGRAECEADVDFDTGNSFLDKAVLIAADKRVAQRLGIGDWFDAHGLGDRSGVRAEVRFFDALDLENSQRNDGKKHVHVYIGDDGFRRDGGMRREILRAEKAFFFGGDE